MWYVMDCLGIDEQKIIHSLRKHLSEDAFQDAFILTCDRMRRYQGAWHLERRSMFPDCVFLESHDFKRLEQELRENQEIMKILGNNRIPKPAGQEEKLLAELCDADHHLSMSKGIIRGGQTFVTEGSLRGKENWIRKIDRHKRMAVLELPCDGKLRNVQVGLEIVEKS